MRHTGPLSTLIASSLYFESDPINPYHCDGLGASFCRNHLDFLSFWLASKVCVFISSILWSETLPWGRTKMASRSLASDNLKRHLVRATVDGGAELAGDSKLNIFTE